MRSEEFDHQQSSITLLKAQLKLVTQVIASQWRVNQ